MKKQTRILVDCIREVLVDEPVKKSWLFGSYARGQEKSDSDVDLIQTRLERATKGAIEFSHFMSPQSAYAQAGHLYDRYREYFGI